MKISANSVSTKGIAPGPSDVDAMRAELSRYLESMRHKTDEEGNLLISYPDNFESIAAAMDRDDLETEQEKPWSRYLFEQNTESNNFDEGDLTEKDKAKAVEERRVQKGLAEIQMLDKQLKAVNRKGAAARYSTPELTLDEASFGGDGNGDENTPNTGRSSAASSRYGGKTFLTRVKSDIYAGEESRQHSARSQSSNATHFTTRSGLSGPQSPSVDLADSLLRAGGDTHSCADPRSLDGLTRPPCRPEVIAEAKRKKFLDENKQVGQGRSRLHPEEQVRVSDLLGFDDTEVGEDIDFNALEKIADEKFDAELKKISHYGYTEDEKHYLDELDNRLRSLRPEIDSSLDAPTNSATMEGASHAVATQGSAKEGQRTAQPNYLVLQRAERTREAYSQQLDLAIRAMKRPMTADLMAGLVEESDNSGDEVDTTRGTSSRWLRNDTASSRKMGKTVSVRDLPGLDDISPGHVIRMEEVLDVINELCHPELALGGDTVSDKNCEDNEVKSYATVTSSLASRSELDALLKQLRPDIIQLSSLRNKKRDQRSRQRLNLNLAEAKAEPNSEGFVPDSLHNFLEMESLPLEPIGVEDVAMNAAQFAQQAAAMAAELASAHDASSKKSKSSKIRNEVRASQIDLRKSGGQFVSAVDFDISRSAVASEMCSGATRPTIRMRAESGNGTQNEHKERADSRIEVEDIIYSAPSSSQSSQRNTPRCEDVSDISFYQSSRRQQAAREQTRSREKVAVVSDFDANKGFLPTLPRSSSRQRSSLNREKVLCSESVMRKSPPKKGRKEPLCKIGSKMNSAIIKTTLDTPSDSPLKVSRTQFSSKGDRGALGAICNQTSEKNDAHASEERQSSREIRTLSTGLDDVHNKLSRLLARADRAHEALSDEADVSEIDTDSDNEKWDHLKQKLIENGEDSIDGADGSGIEYPNVLKEYEKDGEFVVI